MKNVRDAICDETSKKNLVDGFKLLCDDEKFFRCISVDFANILNVIYRFDKIYQLIVDVTKKEIPKMTLNPQSADSQ